MQVHYNLLVGDKPVRNSLVLHTVPMSTPLLPLHLDLMLAPPNIPCPAGVTGPLCGRVASLANEGRRFGQTAVDEVDGIEAICGGNPSDPPVGDSASCLSSINKSGYIVRVQAHMHLLGVAFSMVLNPGTPEAKTVLDVPDYNFHYQRSYNLSTPMPCDRRRTGRGDLYLRPDAGSGAPHSAKGPSAFRDLGRRLDGRDVHRTRVGLGHPAGPSRLRVVIRQASAPVRWARAPIRVPSSVVA